MSLLARNITANFAGGAWSALMSLAFVPLYIHFMGIEAYGLVGFMASLQAISGLLDMGLSATLSREMARLSVVPGSEGQKRDLLRTLEIPYWGCAVLLGALVLSLSPFLASHWIQAGPLGEGTARNALALGGLVIASQWPASLYTGGLLGLQRQVLLNTLNAGVATLRGAGAVLVLWKISPTVEAFFLWQFLLGPFYTLILAAALWRMLPGGERPRFRLARLKEISGFAVGISGISVLALLLTQLDKVVLSRLLSLEMFGYYALATAVSTSLYRLIAPVFSAYYPRFTELVALGDIEMLKATYHRGCQLMSVVLLPCTAVLSLFAAEALLVWTGNPATAANTGMIMSLLVAGTALNGLMTPPYALQLAHGWTRLTLWVNLVAVLLLVPFIVLLVGRYGAVGAAAVWPVLNLGYIAADILLMHRRILPGEQWRWYGVDTGLPLAAALAVALLGRLLVSSAGALGRADTLLALLGVSVATQAAALAATPLTRSWLLERWTALRTA